jgi:hypothetical protein
MIKAELAGLPKEVTVTLSDEEETMPRPPVIVFYGLNGILRFYFVFVNQWRNKNLLQKVKPIEENFEERKTEPQVKIPPIKEELSWDQFSKPKKQPEPVKQPSSIPISMLNDELDFYEPNSSQKPIFPF